MNCKQCNYEKLPGDVKSAVAPELADRMAWDVLRAEDICEYHKAWFKRMALSMFS